MAIEILSLQKILGRTKDRTGDQNTRRTAHSIDLAGLSVVVVMNVKVAAVAKR